MAMSTIIKILVVSGTLVAPILLLIGTILNLLVLLLLLF